MIFLDAQNTYKVNTLIIRKIFTAKFHKEIRFNNY